LSEIRGERIRWMRGDRKYASLVEIYEELDYASRCTAGSAARCSR
jgi:hypothetical protein